jgi:putative SOS response-associated peptidase YedK
MCGRFTLRHPRRIRIWGVPSDDLFAIDPRFNIAPSQPILAVTENDGRRNLGLFDWGLVPSWSTEAAGFINARAETLELKRSFSDSFQRRRCLIPADGFYEWQKRGKAKQPFYFQLQDEMPFAFAGIWDEWRRDGASKMSCAIITTSPNELLATIHDRMPVILPPEAYDVWLHKDSQSEELTRVLIPFPAAAMKTYPVSSDVNQPKIDNESLVQPFEPPPEAQPSLF